MSFQDNKTYKFYKKNEKFIHFIEGVLIIILIAGLWIMYFSDAKIKKEISENCGWGEEDYECFCQRSDAIALKNQLENKYDIVLDDVDT